MNNELSLFGKRKDGSEFPIKISIVPTKKGGLITATIKDVSEKLPNDHFIKKVKQLEDFAYITSHNLRSPVSNLSSLIDIYKREKTSVGKEVLFGKFEQIVEKLSETLNSLVDVLIIQNDANKTISKISFLSIYNKVIANLEYSIKDAQAEIHVDFSKASTIEYSKIYLESIIQNLLSNALKYSSFKRTPIINIKTSIINDKIQLIISDNGLGIDLKKHGSNMFKLNKTFHKNPDAKGVGLYITKAQIDTMGGKITVESKVDKGTTFTIIF